jgi:hypothetical protein
LRSHHGGRTAEIKDVGFEVLTAAVMKYSVFWDTCIKLCGPLKANLTFNGLYGAISQKIELFTD